MALQARLNSEFTSHGLTAPAIIAASDARPDVLHARLMGELFRFQDNETLLGLASENIAGIMARGAAGFVISKKHKQERTDRQSKEQSNTAYFLALLNAGELDSYIADRIIDNMDDAEFSAWVADIEAELDMPIEDYAQDVLGDDMPERMPWESDIDYQRRVMNAVLEEVVGENGRIKPEYADDPVARRVLEHDEYQAVLPTINALNRIEPANAAPSEEAVETVQAIAEDSYQAGNIAARALENETLAEESRDVQDESSDAIFAASAEDEVALFDTDLGFDFASGPGLESAPDAATNFNLAAAEPLQKAAVSTPALEIAATL